MNDAVEFDSGNSAEESLQVAHSVFTLAWNSPAHSTHYIQHSIQAAVFRHYIHGTAISKNGN